MSFSFILIRARAVNAVYAGGRNARYAHATTPPLVLTLSAMETWQNGWTAADIELRSVE